MNVLPIVQYQDGIKTKNDVNVNFKKLQGVYFENNISKRKPLAEAIENSQGIKEFFNKYDGKLKVSISKDFSRRVNFDIENFASYKVYKVGTTLSVEDLKDNNKNFVQKLKTMRNNMSLNLEEKKEYLLDKDAELYSNINNASSFSIWFNYYKELLFGKNKDVCIYDVLEQHYDDYSMEETIQDIKNLSLNDLEKSFKE